MKGKIVALPFIRGRGQTFGNFSMASHASLLMGKMDSLEAQKIPLGLLGQGVRPAAATNTPADGL
jgi:hypothetical protein